jgi:pimeloyl-ACP methyl ester carboxylesterase
MRAIILLAALLINLPVNSQDTLYYGFKCHNFKFQYVRNLQGNQVLHMVDLRDSSGGSYDAKIVFPDKAEPGRHWIWRARFWGHEPQTEIALLRKGFHVVYINAPLLCGGPEAVELWNHFYDLLVNTYELNSKAVLEGMSRGGLYIYNWGSANPDKVACIYADAPVCDICSWPGGKGRSNVSPDDWKLHLKVYGLTEETVNDFKGMPVYNCVKLAQAGVPVLHVCGAVDDVVPIEENSYVLEKAYKAAGGDIRIIVKEGIGHHPHSLRDPTPIVRFILSNTSPELLDKPEPYEKWMSINSRGGLDNSRLKFEKGKKGVVAFLGGEITYNPGWCDSVAKYLVKRFPGTKFQFIKSGIPSLGSVPHSMRFSSDVLAKGKPDLLFVEAAVNNITNAVSPDQQVRGMEGIVYQALRANPYVDIIMMHFADQDKMADYNNGKIPDVIQQNEKVAEHYSVTSINLAKEVNDRVLYCEFSWRDDFRNLHSSYFEQRLYFRTIHHLLDSAWNGAPGSSLKVHEIPAVLLDRYSYINGQFKPLNKAKTRPGWSLVKNWQPVDKALVREGFVNDDVLEANVPGATLKYPFRGTAIGLLVTSGPDAGIIEYSIDGSEFRKADQFTRWSQGLHLPWMMMLEDKLVYGRHRLVVSVSSDKNTASSGTACRIHWVVVN